MYISINASAAIYVYKRVDGAENENKKRNFPVFLCLMRASHSR